MTKNQVELIISISQFIYFYYYMLSIGQIIQKQKYDILKKYIIASTSALMVTIGLLLSKMYPINTIILEIIVFTLFAFILKIKKSKAIIITLVFPIFLVLTEILVVALFVLILDKTADEMLELPYYFLGINLVISIFAYITIYLLNKILKNKQKLKNFIDNFNKKYLKTTAILLLFTFAPQAILIPLNKYNNDPLMLLLNFISLFTISIFLFWYISNYLEKEKIQEQLVTLEMDNKTLGGMVDGVRTIKHDFNNIFQAINGYICSKQYDALEEYISKVMKECNIVNTLSIINKNTFNDPATYGVIGSKYFLATENNISIDLEVTVSFKDINFPKPELSRIFGVLLDNAIEATKKCDDKYIRLEIKFIPKKNATLIRILNTYDTSINIELNNIFTKGYSTKKIKSGLGLWEVKKLVSKQKHSQIYSTIENNKFVQNIIIENL